MLLIEVTPGKAQVRVRWEAPRKGAVYLNEVRGKGNGWICWIHEEQAHQEGDQELDASTDSKLLNT